MTSYFSLNIISFHFFYLLFQLNLPSSSSFSSSLSPSLRHDTFDAGQFATLSAFKCQYKRWNATEMGNIWVISSCRTTMWMVMKKMETLFVSLRREISLMAAWLLTVKLEDNMLQLSGRADKRMPVRIYSVFRTQASNGAKALYNVNACLSMLTILWVLSFQWKLHSLW